MSLSATFTLSASGSIIRDDLVSIVSDNLATGAGTFPALSTLFAEGTGSTAGNINKWYRVSDTVAAGATKTYDLYGALLSPFGEVLSFSKIKGILLAIIAPDGTKALKVGPQNTANAWQGPFSGTGADASITTKNYLLWLNEYDGWTVTANTADVLPIMNPSASTVNYVLWILGY